MRHVGAVLLVGSMVIQSATADAAELLYAWKKGDAHAFHFTSRSKMKMSMSGGALAGGGGNEMGGVPSGMPGMEMAQGMMGGGGGGGLGFDADIDVSCDFTERVTAVRPDGSADVELSVEKLSISQQGQDVDVLSKLPKDARKVKAEVDRKGHAKFFKMVSVFVEENGGLSLAVRSSKRGLGAEATASAGDEEVTVFAEIDPKTGAVRGGAVHKKKKAQKHGHTEQVKQEDNSIDALPKEIFDVMVLPDGDAAPGTSQTSKTPIGAMSTRVSAGEGSALRIDYEGSGDVNTSTPNAPSDMVDSNDAEYRAAQASAKTSTSYQFQGIAHFDAGKGRLLGVTGTMSNRMDAAGMKTDNSTEFKLTRR